MKPLLFEARYACAGCTIAVNEDARYKVMRLEFDVPELWRSFDDTEAFLLNALDSVKQVRRLYEEIDN